WLQRLLWPSFLFEFWRWRRDPRCARPRRRATGERAAGGARPAGTGLAPDWNLQTADCRFAENQIPIYSLQPAICNKMVVSPRPPRSGSAATQPDAAKPARLSRRAGRATIRATSRPWRGCDPRSARANRAYLAAPRRHRAGGGPAGRSAGMAGWRMVSRLCARLPAAAGLGEPG